MLSWQKLLLVAVGSGVGGALRVALVSLTTPRNPGGFPVGVMLVNVIGCFVFGVAARYGVQTAAISDDTRVLITAGLCGGFTTFSAFGMDIVEGLESGRTTMVTTYVVGSIVLGVAAMLLGLSIGRSLSR